jgi:flagellar hook-basal body complex protein FliE
MNIEAIQGIKAFQGLDAPLSSQSLLSKEIDSSNFTNLLTNKMQQVNESLTTSNTMLEMFLKGEPVAVHDVVIAMSKAKSELQLVVEVRNKVLEAYQEITRIQV